MSRFDRWFGMFSSLLNAAGTLLIAFIMVVINLDIAGRALFGRPLTGVTEMVIMSIAAIVFLQFSDTLRRGRVIQADSLLRLIERKSPRAYEAMQAVFCLVGALAFAVIVHATIPFLSRALASGDMYGNPAVFALPKWPVRLIMIVGSVAMAVQFLLLFLRHGRRFLRWGEEVGEAGGANGGERQ
ncbi:MAG: TRAP transporter small permease [Burkholderiaceae bacterium]|nr:TRAP transporter small permease [Burkholderiaceae bacterium]